MKIPEDMPYRGPSPVVKKWLVLIGLSILMTWVITPTVNKIAAEHQSFWSVWSISIEIIAAASIVQACLRVLESRR